MSFEATESSARLVRIVLVLIGVSLCHCSAISIACSMVSWSPVRASLSEFSPSLEDFVIRSVVVPKPPQRLRYHCSLADDGREDDGSLFSALSPKSSRVSGYALSAWRPAPCRGGSGRYGRIEWV